MTEPRPDVTDLPDLASRRLGGSVIAASDELFAEKENLIKPEAPVFAAGAFGNRGKIYDGWETRRRRDPGHDHAIVRLGVPGIVHGVVVDTSFFRGNYPPEVSVEAVGAEGYPSPGELAAMTWHTLVARTDARGDAVNIYPVAGRRRRWTHVRLSIYPDGGVARFRVHGTALPDPRFLAGTIDLAAAEHGGRVTGCSDAFYSSAGNLILPGRAAGMGEGWENARRRGPGHDYVVVALAAAGELRHAEIDTSFFVGNAPGWVRMLAADARTGEPEGRGAAWTEERATKERGTREGGASKAPRRRAGNVAPGSAPPEQPELPAAAGLPPGPGLPPELGLPARPAPPSDPGPPSEPGLLAGPPGARFPWREVLPRTRVQPDTRHRFLIAGAPVATHVRLDVIPDGGLARLRVNGEIVPEALAALRQRWWDALPEAQREAVQQPGA